MMGSHRPRSITGRHYARRKWRRLHRALRVMRRRLVKAGVFDPSPA